MQYAQKSSNIHALSQDLPVISFGQMIYYEKEKQKSNIWISHEAEYKYKNCKIMMIPKQ